MKKDIKEMKQDIWCGMAHMKDMQEELLEETGQKVQDDEFGK